MPGIFGQPGQRESIVRGERTDPRAVVQQAGWLALVGMFAIVLIGLGVMINFHVKWSWVVEHWRWLILIPAIPWIIGAILCTIMLFVELFDPNWPNPRDATGSTTPNYPWSSERVKPPSPTTNVNVKFGLEDLLKLLTVEPDDGESDDDEPW